MKSRWAVLIGTAIVAMLAVVATSSAQDGVITPGNPTLTYTRGPFTGANPSNNVEDEPNCDLVPGTCDDFALRVDLPSGYSAANPDHVILVNVGWDPTNPRNDFDVYIQDPVTGLSVVPPAATSGNPEIAVIPVEDGVRDFRIRVLVFSVVNTSYTATVTLGELPGDTPGVGTYAASADIWSCNSHLEGLSEIPGTPPTVFDHSNDGEPSVRFDPNGKAYVTAIAGVPAGSGLWGVNDACGQTYDFVGAVDAGAGGGDSDVETAPEPNILGNYNVYLSSLTLANITTAASFDGGQTFTVTPVSTPQPVDDRQWNAAHGSSINYLSYWQFPSGIIQVVRMDYTGLGAPIIAGPFTVNGLHVTDFTRIGNMATDRRPLPPGSTPFMGGPDGEGNVYHTYVNLSSQVWVAVSKDFGVTWTPHLVWEGGAGVSYDHVFTWLTVDQAGNVYVAFSDDSSNYYAASQDQGTTWARPVRVNRGGESRTSIFPQMAGGSEGRLVFTWYGHDGTGSQDADAVWKVFSSRCQNALDPVPHFEERIVSDRVFHTGPACQDGLNCSCCRELTECFEIDISPVEGSSLVTYGAFGAGGTYITRQVAGASAIAGIDVPDRSGVCPNPPDCVDPPQCPEPPCQCPGCEVVVDLDSEDAPPAPGPAQNIQSIAIAEPYNDPRGDDVLIFNVKVEDLDLANLPPNTFWRIIFNPPGGMFFVRVNNCATGGLSGDYGHFTTGSVTDGPLDHFELNDDGLICMWIDRDKVGDPQPGLSITGINADCREYVGDCPGGAGVFAPLDVTNSGQYSVRGNDACATNAELEPQATPVSTFSFGLAGANPFAGETQVAFSLPERARVRIDVYNVAGQRVHTLLDRELAAGTHTTAFNPRAAGSLGAGVYWLKIQAGSYQHQVRVVALD